MKPWTVAVVCITVTLAVRVEGVIRVACVGDSITFGVCASDRATTAYPAVLQKLLGSDYNVTNFGNSGKTMLVNGLCEQSGGNCSYWATSTYTDAVNSSPDIVTILLGTNDAKSFNWQGVQSQGDNYTVDYNRMISIFKALPSKPKVFVAVPPPLYPPDPYDMMPTVINGVFPTLLREIASVNQLGPVIDTFSALGGASLSQPNITCDGCHPVDKGYAEMAKVFASAIQNA
eukprot:m.219161 g.219161  ORF g.219161 m.219161 type:complete len:231 (+) comp15109_c1_seq1:75-767(+)